jgi:hypothetical protein
MPYKYGKYTLYKKNIKLKNGKSHTIYFFCNSNKKPKSGTPCSKPKEYKIVVNKNTKFPMLKKK